MVSGRTFMATGWCNGCGSRTIHTTIHMAMLIITGTAIPIPIPIPIRIRIPIRMASLNRHRLSQPSRLTTTTAYICLTR